MAKVNTLIHNEIYASVTNPNIKFHLMVRSFDGTDRKSADVKDDQFINGSIDGVDVLSDCLTEEDHWQSEHIVLRPKEERVFDGHDYRMIESLANSCDIASCADFDQMITDNKGKERRFRQYYTKEPDDKTVHVKSYVEDIFVGETHFDFVYTPTNYSDEDPKETCLTSYSVNYEELQKEIIEMIQKGMIVEKMSAPDIIEDTYTTHDVKFYYKGSWTVDIKPNGEDDYVNEITFVLQYGTTRKTAIQFSSTPSRFSDENYGDATTILTEVAAAEIEKLKAYLDTIAAANDIEIPPDITGFYRAGQVIYYYWLHYDTRTQDNNGDINTTVIYTLRWGTDDTANLFFSDKKSYNIDNYTVAPVELMELGKQQIDELFNHLDNLTGVKLVTVNKDGEQEVGAHPRDIKGNALVVVAHEFEQGADIKTQAMVHFDGDNLVDDTGSSWTVGGGTPITTDQGAAIGKGMLISDGRYISSKTMQMGAESFTVDFFAYVNESCPSDACICDINHPDCDIKIKLLKQLNSKTQETETTIGFYVNNELKAQSKVDIIVLGTVCHYAVVYQQAKHVLFFFVEGTMIGNMEQNIPKAPTNVWFNRDVSANKSTFLGTIDEVRISTDLARWTVDVGFEDYDPTGITDETGAYWKMYNDEVRTPEVGHDKFGTGLFFNNVEKPKNEDEAIYARLLTPEENPKAKAVEIGGADFTIDFWFYLEKTTSGFGGVFELQADNITFGTHMVTGSMCVHKSTDGQGIKFTVKAKTLYHMALVYINKDDTIYVYINGKLQKKYYSGDGKFKESRQCSLKVGRYYGSGPKGPMYGSIDEFRIESKRIPSMFLDDKGNLLSNFTLPNEPYEIDKDYTLALLRSSRFKPQVTTDEDFEVDNPNHIFNPPRTSYKINTDITGDPTQLTNYYIPLAEHFDDDKFTTIDQVPIQKTPYPVYDGETEYEPEWMYYDPQQLRLEGDLKSKAAGSHYVTFTPWNDYLWQGGSDKAKMAVWKIIKDNIKFMPEQVEPLYYNGEEQQHNVINLDPKYMTFTGDLAATDANTPDKPFYVITATPKDNYEWPTGMSGPYDILWQILPRQIERPVLKTTSSLDFVYDGTEKAPEFEYDSRYITATGTLTATLPNAKHIDGSFFTGEYQIIFSLKDKNNYSWFSDHDHEEETTEENETEGLETDDGDNIVVTWKIRRKPVKMFSVSNTTLPYNGEEQGPVLTPSDWDPNEVTVEDHRKKDVGSYVIKFALTDDTKYEWENGDTGEATKEWEITKAQGRLEVDKTTVELIAPPTPPTADITITTASTGNVTCTVPDNFKSYIETNIPAPASSIGPDNLISRSYKLHIKGLKSTETDEPVTLTVTLDDDKNYKGTSVEITVTVRMGLEAFTWAEIADMTAAGTLLDFASIGDAKTVKLKTKLPIHTTEGETTVEYDDSDDYAVKMILIGVDHNPDVEGSNRAHFMLGRMGTKKDIVFPVNIPVFNTSSNACGWRNSNLNLQLNTPYSGIYYADIFPSDFLAVITPCLKWTDNVGGGVNNNFFVTPTLDYVIIPSEYEVFGTSSYANSEESRHQERYAYFAEGGAVKRERTDDTGSNGWALRSVNRSSSTQVAAVGSNGALTSVPINSVLDITPVFTVSRKTEGILDIPAIEKCVETLMHFDDPDDPFKDECNTSFRVLDIKTGTEKDAVISTQNAKFGGALQFDGSTYAVQKIPVILGGKDFTIDFWIKYDSKSDDTINKQARGFVLVGPNSTGLYCHRTANGKKQFTVGIINKEQYTRTDFDPFDRWVHVAMVYHYNRQTVFFYFNGALTTCSEIGTRAVFSGVSLPRGKYTLILGSDPSRGTAMIGAIDELRIQNGIARWTPPEWAFTRRATKDDADRQVFTPPTFAGETSENDILHDQITGGYIVKLNNAVKQKELLITGFVLATINHHLNILNTNPSVATAVYDDSTSMLTIKGVSPGKTTVTLFVDDTDTTYAVVRIFDVICEANIGLTRLQDCEPADIKSIVREGMASKAWSAGETTKDIQLSGTVNGQEINQTVKAKLIAIDHNKDKETAGHYNAYFMISGLDISLPMNDTNTNEGGWASSKMRQDFCEQILNCFPLSWRNIVSYCSKATDNKGSGTDKQESDITVTQDKVFLLSEYEILGTVVRGHNLEMYGQQQYGYFNDVTNRPVTWTRSCVRDANSNSFVSSTGTAAVTKTAGSSNPAVFCFCVSDYAGPTFLDADMSSFSAVKEVEFDGADHNAINEGIILTEAGTKPNSKYHIWTGEFTGRDVGTYTVSIKPAPGYRWFGDTEDIRTVQWKIKAASSENISVNKTEVRLYHKNPEETLTVVRNNTSTLQITVADPSLLSVSARDNQITLAPTGLGETTVTIVSPAAGNYGRGEVTVTVKASNVSALASLTPEQIQAVVLTGNANLAWDVGESTSDIRLNGVVNGQVINQKVKACVLGFDHNSSIEGAKKLHLCLGRDTAGKDTGLFEFTTEASTDYTDSSLRTIACYELFACIPTEWQKVISVSNKKCTTQSDIMSLTDELWLLDIKEILGEDDNNFKRYAYYKGDNSPVRKTAEEISWFTRSYDQSGTPALISAAGTVSYDLTGYIVPCFTVGETKASPNLKASQNIVSVLVGSTENFTVNYEGTGALSFTSSDPTTAAVVQDGKTCTVSGLKTGTAFVVISLSATDTHARSAVVVRIESGTVIKTASTLILSSNNLAPTKGNTASCTATVTGGTLSAVSRDETIATVTVSDNKITVKGINEGSTAIDVKVTGDATHYDSEATINVTVSDKPIILDPIPVVNDWTNISFAGGLVYNSESQSVATKLNGYSSTYHNLSGDTTARDHKDTEDYKVTISPKAGYKWQDSKTEGHDYSWNIDKAIAVISGKQDLILIKDDTETVSITYTVTDTCSLVIKSNSNPDLVTATIDGNKVTFSSSCNTNGSAVIELTTAPTINYNAAETVSVNVTVSMSSLVVLDGQNAASALSVTRSSETYSDDTTYTVKNSNVSTWISNFNSAYHKLTKVTDSNNSTVTKTTVSGEDNYKIKDAGTYKFWIIPVTGYAWDSTGDIAEKSFSWTINRESLGVATATQTGLSGSGKSMIYNGAAQTPVFDIQDKADITVAAQTDAGVYNTSSVQAKVTPKANYCWSDSSTGSKNVSWKIDPARLTVAQEPVFIAGSLVYTLSNKTAQVQKPTVSNFTFNSKFPQSSFTFTAPSSGRSAVGTYDSSSYAAKFKINSSNYVFSDGSNTKIIPWSISPRKIKKPSMSVAYSKPYTGSAHTGIVIANNITTNDQLVTDGYVTVTMNKRLGAASNYDEDGFSKGNSSDHNVDFAPTDAGAYTVIYTLKKSTPSNVIWDVSGAEDTNPVNITFKITRADITTKPTSPDDLPVKYTIDGGFDITIYSQFATIPSDDRFDCTCNPQQKPGTYSGSKGILCTPKVNYKWAKSIQSKQFDAYSVTWKIIKAEGILECDNKSIVLSNDVYTAFLKVTKATSYVWLTAPAILRPATWDDDKNGYNLLAWKTGTDEITIETKEDDYFEASEPVTIPVSVVVNRITTKKPTSFMKNLFAYLEWERIEDDAKSALDSALAKATNNKVKSFDTILSEMKTIATTVKKKIGDYEATTNFADKTKTYLLQYFGIKVEGSWKEIGNNLSYMTGDPDSGSIVGKDIGESSSNISLSDVVKENSPSTINAYPTGDQIIQGCKFMYPEKSSLTTDQQWVIQAASTWWFKNSLLLIEQAYGLSFDSPHVISGSEVVKGKRYYYDRHEMEVVFNYDSDSTALASCGSRYGTNPSLPEVPYGYKYATGDVSPWYLGMQFNTAYLALLDKTDKDGPAKKTAADIPELFDTVTLHELTHGVMYATLTTFQDQSTCPAWFIEGTAELMRGVDTGRFPDMAQLIVDPKLMQDVYNVNNDNYDDDNQSKSYALGYMILRYVIKQYMAGKYGT